MSSAPRFSWDDQRSKNIELNQDINLSWSLFKEMTSPDEIIRVFRQGGGILDNSFEEFFSLFSFVRFVNDKIRSRERDKWLGGDR